MTDDRLPVLRTAVVEGALAFQMRRFAAAQANDCGLQILNLPRLAARLAGGFTIAASPELLEPAIQSALAEGGFVELEHVRNLPGMSRAVLRTFRKIWTADLDLAAESRDGHRRIAEMCLIEARLRSRLPPAAMLPRNLRDAALRRLRHAPRIVGDIRIEGLSFIAPVWRPLIEALRGVVQVEWIAPAGADTDWFHGKIVQMNSGVAKAPAVVSCADVRHEVVESLRWARQLIASGVAKPNEIAITSANTTAWDDHFLACAEGTGFRLHFSHGVSALSTRDGQRCAALADVLMHGLSQQRARRLFAVSRGQGLPPDELPARWLDEIPRGAALSSLADWKRALETAESQLRSKAAACAASFCISSWRSWRPESSPRTRTRPGRERICFVGNFRRKRRRAASRTPPRWRIRLCAHSLTLNWSRSVVVSFPKCRCTASLPWAPTNLSQGEQMRSPERKTATWSHSIGKAT